MLQVLVAISQSFVAKEAKDMRKLFEKRGEEEEIKKG